MVFFQGWDAAQPPDALQHLRCGPDLTCQMFPGPPAQGQESMGDATLSFKGDAGEVCGQGQCTPIARCPAITWTDEERNSGFAAAWEARVLKGDN